MRLGKKMEVVKDFFESFGIVGGSINLLGSIIATQVDFSAFILIVVSVSTGLPFGLYSGYSKWKKITTYEQHKKEKDNRKAEALKMENQKLDSIKEEEDIKVLDLAANMGSLVRTTPTHHRRHHGSTEEIREVLGDAKPHSPVIRPHRPPKSRTRFHINIDTSRASPGVRFGIHQDDKGINIDLGQQQAHSLSLPQMPQMELMPPRGWSVPTITPVESQDSPPLPPQSSMRSRGPG
jgi:hypothetical protein